MNPGEIKKPNKEEPRNEGGVSLKSIIYFARLERHAYFLLRLTNQGTASEQLVFEMDQIMIYSHL